MSYEDVIVLLEYYFSYDGRMCVMGILCVL